MAEALTPAWWLTKDGDLDCLEMYERHYSAYQYADGRRRRLFVGPGEKVVLRTADASAVFVWRNFIDDSGQDGVNCAVFRNESSHQSSGLIRQADAIADRLWPDRRHYTYVDPEEVRSTNPGFCFIAAGWNRCGRTKGGLVILERKATAALRGDAAGGEGSADLVGTIQAMADRAYCDYIAQLRRDECLGWESKARSGKFGEREFEAHSMAAQHLGRHKALSECAKLLQGTARTGGSND